MSWSPFVFGSIATEITGSGTYPLEHDRVFSTASFAVVVGLSPKQRDIAGADLLALLAVVRVQLQDPADALGLAVVVLNIARP